VTKKGLLGWLGRERTDEHALPPVPARLAAFLTKENVSLEALHRANRSRLLMQTRLLSTLVELGEVDEATAVRALAHEHGQPAMCLSKAVFCLELAVLPQELAMSRLWLPLERDARGAVVLACADPLTAADQQELELLLDAPVRPHLALHRTLLRMIRATYELLKSRPEARLLLGENVLPDTAVQESDWRVVSSAPLPELPKAPVVEQSPVAILAMHSRSDAEAWAGPLRSRGWQTFVVDHGEIALQTLAQRDACLMVLGAKLDGISGMDIIVRLSAADRFRRAGKILVVPEGTTRWERFVGLPFVRVVTPAQVPATIGALLDEGIGTDLAAAPEHQRLARAAFLRAQAAIEAHDHRSAFAALREVYGIDPLHRPALCELGRLLAKDEALVEATEVLAFAAELAPASFEEACLLAELYQRQGELRQAAMWWRYAAGLRGDDAAVLLEHANALGDWTQNASDDAGI
jgi:hypothetical protein